MLKKNRNKSYRNRFFNSWWFHFLLGLLALILITLLMFDAVMIGVLGHPVFFTIPK